MSKIAVVISASISAYKSCEIVRGLFHDGHDVHVILTPNALHFVSPLTLEVLSGNPVSVDEFPGRKNSVSAGYEQSSQMPHIYLKNDLDLFAVVPATANLIGKFACGIADNLASTTFLALDRTQCQVLICPAMNVHMYKHPAVQKNIKTLNDWGCHFIHPQEGTTACGDIGIGKLAETEQILKKIESILHTV
jgi:phosphopantothenoylcysteine synthetase/decarboxylase